MPINLVNNHYLREKLRKSVKLKVSNFFDTMNVENNKDGTNWVDGELLFTLLKMRSAKELCKNVNKSIT